MNNRKAIVFIFFLMSLGVVFAQKRLQNSKKDLKIGLVLSGGGAKGFAHVGVLKVLEEAGIRVDYIAGTSMGAIVGGLYASGYNASELDSIIRTNDFVALFQDVHPRKASSFYQKENIGKYALSLPITKGKIGLPKALSHGQNVFNLFSLLTTHVHNINEFDKLPIPFFCIATDLETGDEVVLDHGFLPEAIRASGTFPGLLSPIVIDNRTLVDGGIVDNYPVELLKKKGVDFIIGVDVQGGLKSADEIDSMTEILKQIVGYQIYKDFDKKVAMTNIYINPDIKMYTDFSFDKSLEIVKKGEVAAEKLYDTLAKVAALQNWTPHYPGMKRFKKEDRIKISAISIRGNKNYTEKYILKRLHLEPGMQLTEKEFIERVDELVATGNFKNIQYKIIPEENGSNIVFDLVESDVVSFLQLGLHYDNLYKTGVLLNYTHKHALFKNDFLSFDLVVGDKIRYNLDYFVDDGSFWSLGFHARYNEFQLNIPLFFDPDEPDEELIGVKVPVDYENFANQFFIQTAFYNKLALRVGAEHQLFKVYVNEIVDDKNRRNYLDNSHYFNLFGKATFDSYDKKDLPKNGFYLSAMYKTYLFSSDYTKEFNPFAQVYGNLGIARTYFDKLTLHLTSSAGIIIGPDQNIVHYYHLGGNNENFINTFDSFLGYDVAEFNDRSYVKTGLSIRYELFKNNSIAFTGNFARVTDDLWNDGLIFADTRTGYAFGYSWETLIGPIQLTYSWSPETNNQIWYFNLGFWF